MPVELASEGLQLEVRRNGCCEGVVSVLNKWNFALVGMNVDVPSPDVELGCGVVDTLIDGITQIDTQVMGAV